MLDNIYNRPHQINRVHYILAAFGDASRYLEAGSSFPADALKSAGGTPQEVHNGVEKYQKEVLDVFREVVRIRLLLCSQPPSLTARWFCAGRSSCLPRSWWKPIFACIFMPCAWPSMCTTRRTHACAAHRCARCCSYAPCVASTTFSTSRPS